LNGADKERKLAPSLTVGYGGGPLKRDDGSDSRAPVAPGLYFGKMHLVHFAYRKCPRPPKSQRSQGIAMAERGLMALLDLHVVHHCGVTPSSVVELSFFPTSRLFEFSWGSDLIWQCVPMSMLRPFDAQ